MDVLLFLAVLLLIAGLVFVAIIALIFIFLKILYGEFNNKDYEEEFLE
jgi:hypothetical protein